MKSKWSHLSHLQLGKIAELYAKIEFLSHDFEIYDTVLDDRGIDFVARKDGKIFEIQVKAVRNYNYTFISESKMPYPLSNARLVCYIYFLDDTPNIYIIPTSVWNTPNEVFTYKTYDGLKSNPEFGINISKKHISLLEQYGAKYYFTGDTL